MSQPDTYYNMYMYSAVRDIGGGGGGDAEHHIAQKRKRTLNMIFYLLTFLRNVIFVSKVGIAMYFQEYNLLRQIYFLSAFLLNPCR